MIRSESEYNKVLMQFASIPRALEEYKGKLARCGYTSEEIESLTASTRVFMEIMNADLSDYENAHGIKSRDIQ